MQAYAESNFETNINVQRWREDIQTFSQTTQQILESITDQLSNGLAAPATSVRSTGREVVEIDLPPESTPVTNSLNQAGKSSPSTDTQTERSNQAVVNAASGDDNCDNLIAHLKRQLAQQLDH